MHKHTKITAALVAFAAVIFLSAGMLSAGQSPLRKAVDKGDINKVKDLIAKGADINEWKEGNSILMIAVWNGNLEMSKLLIEKGADINAHASGGWSALTYAAKLQNPDLTDLLLVKGADLDVALEGMAHWVEYLKNGPYPNNAEANKVMQGLFFLQGRAGMTYYQAGQYDKAFKVLSASVKNNPNDANSLIGLAFCQTALKNYADARTTAEAAVKAAPDNFEAYLALADSLLNLGQNREALEPLQKAALLNPKNIGTFNRLANVYYLLDDYSKSIENFQKVAEMDPDKTGPITNIMNVCARAGRLDEAIAAAGRLIDKQKGKESAETYAIRSFLLFQKGQLDDAAKDAEKAASIDAANNWSLLATGTVALNRGDYQAALKNLEAIKDNDFTLAIILTAEAYAKMGKMDDAERIYAGLGVNVASTNNLAVTNARVVIGLLKPTLQAHLDKAAKLGSGPGGREALDEYAKALKLSDEAGAKDIRIRAAGLLKSHPDLIEPPEETRKLTLQAEVLMGEKKPAEALDKYEAALGITPFSPKLHHDAAVIAAGLQKYGQAVSHMNAYLELMPDAADARDAKDLIYKWEFMKEQGAQQK